MHIPTLEQGGTPPCRSPRSVNPCRESMAMITRAHLCGGRRYDSIAWVDATRREDVRMKQIEVAVIGTGWCGGIRAETSACHPLVKSLHLAEIRPERLRGDRGEDRREDRDHGLPRAAAQRRDRARSTSRPRRSRPTSRWRATPRGRQARVPREADRDRARRGGRADRARPPQPPQVHDRLLAALQPEVRLRAPVHPRRHHRQAGERAGEPAHHAQPGQEDQRPRRSSRRRRWSRRTTSTSCCGASSRPSRCACTRR